MGIVISVPITNHYCGGILTQETMSQSDEHACCAQEEESASNECCEIEIHFFSEDHHLNITFSNFELDNLSDYWTENLLFDVDLRFDTYQFTKGYINSSDTPPKNETGLYKYVQSLLI